MSLFEQYKKYYYIYNHALLKLNNIKYRKTMINKIKEKDVSIEQLEHSTSFLLIIGDKQQWVSVRDLLNLKIVLDQWND
jgi:hypothetical protein